MRILAFLLLLALPARGEEILLSGPPVWESAPLIAMAEDQPLADRGITFTFSPWASPEALRSRLMDEAPFVAAAPSLMAALFDARGIDVRMWSATSGKGSLLLVGRGAALEHFADLGERSVALPYKGNLPDLLMQRLAASASFPFEPVYTGNYMATMQLVLAGRADVALLPEPLATALTTRAPELTRLADICDLWRGEIGIDGCPPGAAIVANFAQDRPEVRAAYEAAFVRLAAEPDAAGALLARAFPELPEIAGSYADMIPQSLNLPGEREKLEAFYAEIFAIAPEALGGRLPDAAFYGWSP